VDTGVVVRHVGRSDIELLPDAWRDIGIAVDLSMRMIEGDADGDPTVLEDKDVRHLPSAPELCVTVGPHLDDPGDALDAHVGQASEVVVGIDNHLRRADRPPHLKESRAAHAWLRRGPKKRRKSVLEHGDVEACPRDLRRGPPRPCRAQWATLVRWEKRAALPMAGEHPPLAGDGVAAAFGHRPIRLIRCHRRARSKE